MEKNKYINIRRKKLIINLKNKFVRLLDTEQQGAGTLHVAVR